MEDEKMVLGPEAFDCGIQKVELIHFVCSNEIKF